ncbi:ectonucleoside triphosphate diphosphohydrolase 8 isoform X6 [Bos indicus]|uniref:Ectonucleoside triphosphate diphosphohydrolase 8 n=1 Tax=Bos indicus TaxID=9915 RepID=A0ABM4T745_BOSIN|nr:ectonucleoside triphosphate diphosphohydrolase 8 isoform X5 [Bos indicus x Bos taurus]
MPCTGRAPRLYSAVLGPARRPAGVGCLSPGEDEGRCSQWSRGAPAAPRVPVLPPSMGLTWKQRVFTALLGAAAVSGLTALLLVLVGTMNVLLPPDTKFGIVFDAGSSHTSLFVYQWPANKENDTGIVSQALACQAEGPGISSYASDPARVGESLQGCLEEALALIPKAKHHETPMFLGATAGMRLLSRKNRSQAEDVFAAVSRALGQSPVDFRGAELLTGQDEGAFGWITINYILGLLVKASTGLLIRHPCYHSGYRGTLALASLYESPCAPAAPPDLSQNLTVEGTGNPGACVEALRKLFNFSSCDGREDCAFAGVYQPPVQGQFYAFSNFYYTFNFLNLTSKPSLSGAKATIWEFCLRPWKLVEASAPPGQDRWLRDYCASGLYILTLLVEGYGFSEETWGGIEFRQQAGGADIGWTLGYMLNLTNLIPAEAPAQGWAQSFGVWVAGVVFVVLTLAATLGAVAVQVFWLQD